MAREEDRQFRMPARQEEQGARRAGGGGLTRSPFGWGGDVDFWSASPYQIMRRMQEDMDRLFGSFFGQPSGGAGGAAGRSAWSPSVDLYETENEVVVKADVPGVEPEDLEVTCTEDALVLRGETRREEERREGGGFRTERRYGR